MIGPELLAKFQRDYPVRNIAAMHTRFVRWASKRTVSNAEAAFSRWCENAERDDTDRLQAGARNAGQPFETKPLGERSDPTYAAFRQGIIAKVLAGATPGEVADLLAAHHDTFAGLPCAGVEGGLGQALDDEIARYRLNPRSWVYAEEPIEVPF